MAKGIVAGLAEVALPALAEEALPHCGTHDMSTWSPRRDAGDALADLLHHAGALVAEHASGVGMSVPFWIDRSEWHTPDARHAHLHLAGAGCLDLEVLDLERLVRAVAHRSPGAWSASRCRTPAWSTRLDRRVNRGLPLRSSRSAALTP